MVLHMIIYDHPSASSPRSQKALCGIYTHPRAMAPHRDDVTCPLCIEALKAEDAGPQTAEEMFGTDADRVGPPAHSPYGDPLAGYRPKDTRAHDPRR